MRTAVHITWHGAQKNFGDLTPYLTNGTPYKRNVDLQLSLYLPFSMDYTRERSMLTSLIKYPSSIQRIPILCIYPRTHDSLSISFRKHSLKNKRKTGKVSYKISDFAPTVSSASSREMLACDIHELYLILTTSLLSLSLSLRQQSNVATEYRTSREPKGPIPSHSFISL
jgi:hypothetical protein